MSVHVSSWAWDQRAGDFGAKLVLMKLADNANDKGIAWPHEATIAAECECSERTVRRKIADLKELGLIRVVRDSSRPGSPNVYQLASPNRGQIDLTAVADVRSVEDRASGLIDREPSLEPEDRTVCPQCGLKPPGTTTLTEHLENVHGVRAA